MGNRGTNKGHLFLSLTVRISAQIMTVSTSNVFNFYSLSFIQEHSAWIFPSSWNLLAQELRTFNALVSLDQNPRSRMFIHLEATRQPWAEADHKGELEGPQVISEGRHLSGSPSPQKRSFGALPPHPDPTTRWKKALQSRISPHGGTVQYTLKLAPGSSSDFRGKHWENLNGCLFSNLNFCELSGSLSSQLENESVGLNIPKGITQCWRYSVR